MVRYHSAVMSVSLLAMALAGCNKSPQDMSATSTATTPASGLPALPAALPMQTGPASQLTIAPPVAALPVRRYVGVSRPANQRAAYAYLDRASDIEDEIGDAPPDYDYDNNDGVSPWVWETGSGDYRYAEPVDHGYRYYYYQPGEDQPYLVRTHDYSYAYAGGALVAIYALSGALLPHDRYDGYRDQASRYFWRGQQLRRSGDERPHRGVVAANWAAQRRQFSAAQANWADARSQQPDWQAYHAHNDPSQQPDWQRQREQRQQVAQQFSGWQSRGLASAPPPVLAVAGTRAAPPRADRQPRMPEPQGFAEQQQRRPDMAGPPAAAPRDRQLAAQREAQHQQEASQRLAQETAMAQQEAAAQRQAGAARQQQFAARQEAEQRQMAASVRRQQDMAAQQQVAAQQRMQQHEAMLATRQEQHAMAVQRQAEVARMPAPRPEPQALMREHAPMPAAPRAMEMAPGPEAARAPVLVQRPTEARPPAVHVEPPHPGPGHDNQSH